MQHRIVSTDEPPRAAPALGGWRSSRLEPGVGSCLTECYASDQGLSMAYTRYAPRCDLVEESDRSAGGRALTVTVALDGESGFRGAGGEVLRFRGGFTTVASSCASVGERRFAQGKPVSQLRVSVDEEGLARYLGLARAEALLGRARVRQIAFHGTASACLVHAQALARQACADERNALAVHLHMLGVLHEESWRLAPPSALPERRARPCGAVDIDKAERAHEIMRQTLAEPLALTGIAALVGASPAKLRQAFQARYDCSPQQALLALRMQRAHALLEDGLLVATAAYRVGYAHPANFSAAFTRHFGRTPKSVFKGVSRRA